MNLGLGLRRSLLWSLSASGLPALVARAHGGPGGILSFHRIYAPADDEFGSLALSVSPTNFRHVIETLIQRRYRFLSMSALVDHLLQPRQMSEKFVSLTFDDGFFDTYTNAFAICREFAVPMTVYLVSSFIRNDFPVWSVGLERIVAANAHIELDWPGEKTTLSSRTQRQKRQAYQALASRFVLARPEEVATACAALGRRYKVNFQTIGRRHVLSHAMIREMQQSGLVEFGAHTVHHCYLSRLDDRMARAEIAQSKLDCEAIVGAEVRHFAYPYGDRAAFGPREIAICRELGFHSAVTTESDTIRPSDRARLLSLPRLSYSGEFQDTPLLDLLLSGTLPAIRRTLAGRSAPSPLKPALSSVQERPAKVSERG